MAPSSQGKEPPQKPGRFNTKRVHTAEGLARGQARKDRKARRKAKVTSNLSKTHEQTSRLHDVHPTNPRAKLCGICREILPSVESLRAHVRDVHGLKTKTATTYLVPPTATLSADQRLNSADHVSLDSRSSSGAPADPYEQETRERRMDATYGMGGTARDHGRFGSAASHDGMDDESSP